MLGSESWIDSHGVLKKRFLKIMISSNIFSISLTSLLKTVNEILEFLGTFLLQLGF